MFDVKWIRENPEAFDNGLAKRKLDPMSSEIVKLDEARRALRHTNRRAAGAFSATLPDRTVHG